MKYKNAAEFLPPLLVEELQRYIQGGYVYIPIRQNRRKRWGEVSGYRKELAERNALIQNAFRNGETLESVAEQFSLSCSAIRKIIYHTE